MSGFHSRKQHSCKVHESHKGSSQGLKDRKLSIRRSNFFLKNCDSTGYHTPKINGKDMTCLIPMTPQMTKKSNISLVKDLCCIAKLKQQRSKDLKEAVKNFRLKYGSLRSVAKRLGLSWGSMQHIYLHRRVTKAKYIRKIDEETKNDIQKFYVEGPITMPLPEAQYAGVLFLNRSLKEACELFNKDRGTKRKVALSTFAMHRPKKVKLQGKIPIASSLCDACTNFKLLGQAISANGIKGVVVGGRDAVKRTVCQYEHLVNDPDPTKRVIGKFGFRKCIFRECSKCGVFLLKHQIRAANEIIDDCKLVQWHQWKNVKKIMKGVEVNRVEKSKECGKLCELLDKYLDAVKSLSTHLFHCQWQYHQIAEFKSSLEPSHMICSHDFAKNITCYSQREVQAGFYDHVLVTLHPSVCFHRCERPLCNEFVRHEIIHLSPILNHNAAAFKVFHRDTVRIIEEATGIDFSLILNVTDQAPSQYKNKNAFLFMSEYQKPTIHMYLGSRHGKFHSDGAAGRFLQFLRREIASERVHISCAKDIASFAKKSYATPKVDKSECQHFRISINLVTKIWKSGERSVRVEETREFHAVRNTGIPGLVETRNIGCVCLPCITGNGSCKSGQFSDPWTERCVARRLSYGNRRLFWPLSIASKIQNSEKQDSFHRNYVAINSDSTEDCSDVGDKNRLQVKKRHGLRLSKLGGLPVFQTKSLSWSKVLKDMSTLPNYDALVSYCANLSIPPLPNEFKGRYASSNVDMITLRFVKNFPNDYFPLKVGKDGNCFPRSLSKIIFNTESQHEQLRVRMLSEALLNEDKYLDNAYLRIGVDQLSSVDLVQHYSEYSEQYNSSMTLDESTIRQIYRDEWFKYRLIGSYSGAYQFHSSASVMNTKIVSHYPATVVQTVYKDLNRPFFPVSSSGNENLKTCHIQWTKSNENSIRLEHFVPLVKKSE